MSSKNLPRGQWQLVVTELPYKVGAQLKVLAELDSLTNPESPGGQKDTVG